MLGIAAIALSAVAHYFTGGTCSPARELNQSAPDGVRSTTIVTTPCASSTEVSVKLNDSGKTYLMFLAASSLTDPEIELRWISSSSLELYYPSTLQVRIPPETTAVRNFFGRTEVIYKTR